MTMFRIEDRGRARWLILDNPGKRNAVTPTGWDELTARIGEFAASEQRVLVLAGAGEDFCSGADLAAAVPPDDLARVMRSAMNASAALFELARPTVAAVDGVAAGGGFNLALACDLIVATDRARFAQSFVLRGLSIDLGGTWLLPRRVGLGRAMEAGLTGRVIAADEALEWGIVSRVVSPESLEDTTTGIADRLAGGAPLAQRFIKNAMLRSFELSFREALELERDAWEVCVASHDVQEGTRAFLDKRLPEFHGR